MNAERKACAEGTRRLAQWAADVDFEHIPDIALERAARVLADDLAAIIGARDEPEVSRFHELLLGRAKNAEATIWNGGRARVDKMSAAVANALAADWLELDEGYRVTACHAGLYVVPVLLAEAECRNLTFREMLRVLVLGYEVVTRVARAWTSPVLTMQAHGRYCAIGAAASASLASRKSALLLFNALTNAATLIGPSPRNHLVEGALVRNVWPAAGAWSGMMAADWADCGISGLAGGLYDVYSTVLGGKAHPERLSENLGKAWAILDGYTKVYACCQHLHSALEATVELRSALLAQAELGAIDSIDVETHALALPLTNVSPDTTLGAKFSMPHAIAAALAIGNGGADAFGAKSLERTDIAQLRNRVSIRRYEPDLPPPNDRPARVTVHLRDGRQFVAECLSAIGGPDRPLPPNVVIEKMKSLASPAYPAIIPVFEELMQLLPARLEQGWPRILAEICGADAKT